MADTKISALPSGAAGVSTVDAFPIARAGSNFKLSLDDVFNLAGGYVNNGTTGTTYAFPSLSVLANGSGSTGYVGIGTKTPTASLDVLGTSGINIRSSGTAQLRLAGTSSTIGTSSLDITHTTSAASILNRASTKLSLTSNGSLGFGTTSTERMTISADGQTISILNPGTTNNTILYVGQAAATGETGVKIGYGRTGSGYAYVDLIGDTTYSTYGFRIVRGNAGANAATSILHKGTGDFIISAEQAAPIKLTTNGTTRLTVGATGGVTLDATPATSSNDTTVATTGFVNNISLGVGQQWNIPGTSRVAGTVYTNTLSRPIGLSVRCFYGAASGWFQLWINGSMIFEDSTNFANNERRTCFGIVEPGAQYHIETNNVSVVAWYEMVA